MIQGSIASLSVCVVGLGYVGYPLTVAFSQHLRTIGDLDVNILAGRAINDAMPKHIAEIAIKELNRVGKVIRDSIVLIMGLTYKENVPDTRESPAEEVIHELKEFDIDVSGYDPLLSPAEIEQFGAKPVASLKGLEDPVDCIIINSPHSVFAGLTLEAVLSIWHAKPIIVDVTGMPRNNGGVPEEWMYCPL